MFQNRIKQLPTFRMEVSQNVLPSLKKKVKSRSWIEKTKRNSSPRISRASESADDRRLIEWEHLPRVDHQIATRSCRTPVCKNTICIDALNPTLLRSHQIIGLFLPFYDK